MNEYLILSLSERIPAKPKLHWKIDIIDHWMLEKIEHFIRIHPQSKLKLPCICCAAGKSKLPKSSTPSVQLPYGWIRMKCSIFSSIQWSIISIFQWSFGLAGILSESDSMRYSFIGNEDINFY